MSKRLKKLPKFKTEAEERKFWQTHDSTEYIDPSKLQLISFPNLKKTADANTFELPPKLAGRVRKLAKKKNVSSEKLIEEFTLAGLQKSTQRRRAA